MSSLIMASRTDVTRTDVSSQTRYSSENHYKNNPVKWRHCDGNPMQCSGKSQNSSRQLLSAHIEWKIWIDTSLLLQFTVSYFPCIKIFLRQLTAKYLGIEVKTDAECYTCLFGNTNSLKSMLLDLAIVSWYARHRLQVKSNIEVVVDGKNNIDFKAHPRICSFFSFSQYILQLVVVQWTLVW